MVVGLQIGTRTVTGVYATANIPPPSHSRDDSLISQKDEPVSAYNLIRRRIRAEAGAGVCPTIAVASMLDIRPSHIKDFVGNQSFWLKSRNPLFKDLKAAEPAKNYLLACEAGKCTVVDL